MKCSNQVLESQGAHFSSSLTPPLRSAFKSALVSILAALALAGCFKPQSRVNDPNGGPGASGEPELQTATFFVDEVKGSSQVSSTLKGYSIPAERSYNFAVCVKSKRSQDPVKGHRFVLSGGSQEQALQSEIDGCVRWTETLNFNFLSTEKYVPFRRVLKADGIHSGARELRFAVNPWNFGGKSAEVVDLTRSKIPSGNLASEEEGRALLKGLSVSGDMVARQLWPKTNIEIQSESGGKTHQGINRLLTFKIGAGILLYDMENRSIVYELTDAKLQLEVMLIAQTNVGGVRSEFKIWESETPARLIREGDAFRVKVPVNLSMSSSTGATLLAVRVSPVDGPANLRPFEGLYEIGEAAKLISNGATGAVLRSSSGDGKFNFESYVKDLKSLMPEEKSDLAKSSSGGIGSEPADRSQGDAPAAPAPAPSGISRLKAFKLAVDKPVYLGTVEDDETTRKTVRYSAKVCVSDNSNGGKPASDVEFTIVKPDGVAIKKRALNDSRNPGCLVWEDSITYKTYAPERIIALPVTIRHESGFEEKIKLALNPWSPWSFGFDMNEAADFVDQISRRTPIESRLLADGFVFDSVDHRTYEVDEYLTLRIVKRVRLRVGLRVQRDNNIRSGKDIAPEPLRAGVYVLRAAIQMEYKDPSGRVSELISPMRGGDRLVRVRGGELKHDIDFEIVDVHLMRGRANLIFEVHPIDVKKLTENEKKTLRTEREGLRDLIDRESELVTPTFVGPLWIRDEAGSGALLPSDDLLSDPSGARLGKSAPLVREALRPLANVTVDKMMERMKELEQGYRSRMRALSSLSGVLKAGNLEYVPVHNEDKILKQDARLASNNRGLPAQGAAGRLLEVLNSRFSARDRLFGPKYSLFDQKAPVTHQTLLDLAEGRRGLDLAMAARLCVLMLEEMPKRMAPEGQFVSDRRTEGVFRDECIKRLGGTDFGYGKQSLEDVFSVERKIRVFEKDGIEYLGGRALGLQVGADVSFGRSNAENVSDVIGVSPSKVIEALGKIPVLSFLNVPGALGINSNRSKTWSDNRSISEGSSFRSGLNLGMEQVELKMTLKRYESCAVVRVNPKFWDSNVDKLRFMNTSLTPEQKLEIISRGLMICSGYEEKKPVEIKERYYSFTQGVSDEVIQDRGDVLNHPWLLALRGTRDYARFILLIEAKKADASHVNEQIDTGTLPLERLKAVYENAMPGVPGVYTVDPHLGLPKSVGSRP